MKLSIFTPTNNVQWINKPFQSIKSQLEADSLLNVEWVIVPNNGAEIPQEIVSCEWVKIFNAPPDLKTIGGLKRMACELSTGDIFIELDHDDELTPGSLRIIQNSLEGKENAFLFSNKYNYNEDGSDRTYSSYYGWESFYYNNHIIMKSFEVNPRSLCEIFFAPDHVRVWTRKAYELAGGHNKDLLVGDDHELVIKTYLAGAEFVLIEEPLYSYYVYGTNSWLKHCNQVQIQQGLNKENYTRALVDEWCRRTSLPQLSFYDLQKEYYNPNSIGSIKVTDELTKLPLGQSIIDFFNRCYEVLVPAGWLFIDVPSTDGRGAFCDPTHLSFWNELSFRYYCDKNVSHFLPNNKSRFQQVTLKTHFPSKWHEQNNIPYVRSDMCALKGQRQPGGCSI